MRRLKLEGKNADEKLAYVERVLGHMRSRSNKKVIGYVPSIPVASYAINPAENGLLFGNLFFAGKLKQVALRVGKYNVEEEVTFKCVFTQDEDQYIKKITTDKKVLVVAVDIDVSSGDSLAVFVENPKTPEGVWVVEDIWFGVLYEPSIQHSKIIKFVREELEDLDKKDEEV